MMFIIKIYKCEYYLSVTCTLLLILLNNGINIIYDVINKKGQRATALKIDAEEALSLSDLGQVI